MNVWATNKAAVNGLLLPHGLRRRWQMILLLECDSIFRRGRRRKRRPAAKANENSSYLRYPSVCRQGRGAKEEGHPTKRGQRKRNRRLIRTADRYARSTSLRRHADATPPPLSSLRPAKALTHQPSPMSPPGSRSAKRSGSRCINEDAPWATSVSTSITIPPLPEGDRVNGHMPYHTIALKVPSV